MAGIKFYDALNLLKRWVNIREGNLLTRTLLCIVIGHIGEIIGSLELALSASGDHDLIDNDPEGCQ